MRGAARAQAKKAAMMRNFGSMVENLLEVFLIFDNRDAYRKRKN